MRRTTLLFCIMSLCTTLCWGQTWNLTETMTATLDDKGVLTISTTKDAEAMPDYVYGVHPVAGYTMISSPWFVWYGHEDNHADKILSVVIENKVTRIGAHAFMCCINLTSVTIPNSVTTIGLWAFSTCPSLTSITIPKSVYKLGEGVFFSCKLKDVTVEWTTPLSLGTNDWNALRLFRGIDYSAATLHVPTGTKARYQAAFEWKNFGTIVEYTPTYTEYVEISTLKAYTSNGILHISGLQTGKPISIYSISGQLVYKGVAKAETEQIPLNVNGVYIVTSGNQTIKLVVK